MGWTRSSSYRSSNYCNQWNTSFLPSSHVGKNFTISCELALPASRLWAAMKSFYLVFPHLAPGTGDTMEVIEGKPGHAGSLTKITFGPTEGGPVGAFATERLEKVDDDKMTLLTREIEGGYILVGFSKWQTTTTLIPIGEKKVTMQIFIEYECDPTNAVCDMLLEQAQEGIRVTFKAVEACLLSSDLFL